MGFKIGQVYIHNADDRMAVVTQIRSDGREGLLRFQKTGKEEWFLWTEFQQSGKWRSFRAPSITVAYLL
jgi:hypothetical protein